MGTDAKGSLVDPLDLVAATVAVLLVVALVVVAAVLGMGAILPMAMATLLTGSVGVLSLFVISSLAI